MKPRAIAVVAIVGPYLLALGAPPSSAADGVSFAPAAAEVDAAWHAGPGNAGHVPDAVPSVSLSPSPGALGGLHGFSHPIWYRANMDTDRPFWSRGSGGAAFNRGSIDLTLGPQLADTFVLRLPGPSAVIPTPEGLSQGGLALYGPRGAGGGWLAATTLRYAGVQDGVDMAFSGAVGGLKYDLTVAAHADLDAFSLSVEG